MDMTLAPVLDKTAETVHPIHDLLAKRWSPRAYDARPVSAADVGSLLEAARWAPSSMNEQPWRFIVADKATDPAAHARMVDLLMEGNAVWAKDAPLLIMAVTSTHLSRNGKPNGKALYDLGQAVAHLSVQATDLGLVVHQMGGFFKDQAAPALNIPEGFEPGVVLAIGYQGDAATLPPPLQEREVAPRSRKPLTEIAFSGKWGNPTHFSEN